jgi:hypothetical protein
MSGQAGGTLFEIFAAVCPHVEAPISAPIQFDFDIASRTGYLKVGDVVENDVDTLRAIGSDDPYQILVRIPGGFEYTGPNSEAETALPRHSRWTAPARSTTNTPTAIARWPSSSTKDASQPRPSTALRQGPFCGSPRPTTAGRSSRYSSRNVQERGHASVRLRSAPVDR